MNVDSLVTFSVDEEALKILGASSPLLFLQQNPELVGVTVILRVKGEKKKTVLNYIKRNSDLRIKQISDYKVILFGSISDWQDCFFNFDPIKHNSSTGSSAVEEFLGAMWSSVIYKGNSVFMITKNLDGSYKMK